MVRSEGVRGGPAGRDGTDASGRRAGRAIRGSGSPNSGRSPWPRMKSPGQPRDGSITGLLLMIPLRLAAPNPDFAGVWGGEAYRNRL